MDPKELAKKIADVTSEELQAKFMKGQEEHGGDFATKPTVKNIREEVLDLIDYTYILEQHKQELHQYLLDLRADVLNVDGDFGGSPTSLAARLDDAISKVIAL